MPNIKNLPEAALVAVLRDVPETNPVALRDYEAHVDQHGGREAITLVITDDPASIVMPPPLQQSAGARFILSIVETSVLRAGIPVEKAREMSTLQPLCDGQVRVLLRLKGYEGAALQVVTWTGYFGWTGAMPAGDDVSAWKGVISKGGDA